MNDIADLARGFGSAYRTPSAAPPDADQVEIAHDQFREILTRLPEAGKPLHDALTRIVDCRVAEESWTGYTVSLAVAYSAAEGYTLAALRRLTEITSFFEEGVRISAVNWKAAEDASTVKAV